MTPRGLALSPDGKRLYVACSDANAVAVVDVSQERSHVEGFIPTGWYPTAVRVLPIGNAGGAERPRAALASRTPTDRIPRAGPSPCTKASRPAGIRGPHPDRHGILDRPSPTTQLAGIDQDGPRQFALPRRQAGRRPTRFPPIQHVIYIVKENRTYDQVLGDMKEGNGDPSLVLFGENVTPNQHKMAREFVLLDNFYVNCRRERRRPQLVHRGHRPRLRPEDVAQQLRQPPQQLRLRRAGARRSLPPAGYLWTNAVGAGLSIRNFGYMAQNRPEPAPDGDQIETVRDPVLSQGHQPLLSRLRSGLSGRGARQGLSRGAGGV